MKGEKGKTGQEEFVRQVRNLWLTMREKVPGLKEMNKTEVLFQKLSTDPDRKNKALAERKIGTLNLEEGKWGGVSAE